jgi:transposase
LLALVRALHIAERVDYDFVPGYFRRRVHQLQTLLCTHCQTEVMARAPTRPFENSPYGAGLIAHVVVQKCACSMPIYRLEKQFQWLGIPVSRSTMTDLFHMAADKVRPLYERLLYRIAHSDVVLADETTMTIQERAKRGYMWTVRTDNLIAYKFSTTRSGKTPLNVLGGTEGTLVVDANTGYNPVVDVDGRVRAGCLAHYLESDVIWSAADRNSDRCLARGFSAPPLQITPPLRARTRTREAQQTGAIEQVHFGRVPLVPRRPGEPLASSLGWSQRSGSWSQHWHVQDSRESPSDRLQIVAERLRNYDVERAA